MADIINNFLDRRRPQEGNHERTLAAQQLDALLRVEELLTNQLEGLRHIAKLLAGDRAEAKPEPKTKTTSKR